MRRSSKNMKIVTVNVPESYLDVIDKLTGRDGLYPSRSELIRCAVRAFLLRELKMAKRFEQHTDKTDIDDEKKYVRIPIDSKNEKDERVREFKTYKIIKRLEF